MSETKITCPHCGAELKVTLAEVTPQPTPEPTPTDERTSFSDLLAEMNKVLESRGYNPVTQTGEVFDYLSWVFNYADRLYEEGAWMFRPENYPLICDYRGSDMTTAAIGYNAMQAWLMASCLAELVPDIGETTNTQTELYRRAYEIGGGSGFPLYSDAAFKADPYAMREVAGIIYAICRSDQEICRNIKNYRGELGGHLIPASSWDGFGYANKMLTDDKGRRGYRMTYLGYCVNTSLFLPSAPGPRVPGTTVCELPQPWEDGQDKNQFADGNYLVDQWTYDDMVQHWNMMSQTSLEEWMSYSREKQNRLVNAAAIPRCTYMYMFGRPKRVSFDGIIYKSYDGHTMADYFTFSETNEDTGLCLDGPFSDLEGMYRYNAQTKNSREQYIEMVSELADNMRFPTQDPNYGRCRPGCADNRKGGEKNPVHGSQENELYNIDLCAMVADNEEQRENILHEDGFAADSPRSYVSGHSAQIFTFALLLTQMDADTSKRPQTWVRKAYEYSVNRSVGRFHWMSDCIYGRLFATMTLPLLNAMNQTTDGYEDMRRFVQNPTPQGEDCCINITIRNESQRTVSLNGQLCMVLENPDKNGVYYGWDGPYNRTGHIVFDGGGLVLNPGEKYTYTGIGMKNDDVVVRGRNPLPADLLPVAGRPSNVLLYDLEGNSENFVPTPIDSGIIFEDGTSIYLDIRT